MESTLVVVLLQELLLSFRLLVSRLVGSFEILLETLFFWHSSSTFDLLLLQLTLDLHLLIAFDATEFS